MFPLAIYIPGVCEITRKTRNNLQITPNNQYLKCPKLSGIAYNRWSKVYRWTLKKIPTEIIIFFSRKNIFENQFFKNIFEKKQKNLKNSKFQKLKIWKIFLKFDFKNIFSREQNINFRRDFRVHLYTLDHRLEAWLFGGFEGYLEVISGLFQTAYRVFP